MAIAQQPTQPHMLIPQTSGLTQVHIKGPDDDGLDDLIRRHTARSLDGKKEIEVVGENKFGMLLKKYEHSMKKKDSFYWINNVNNPLDVISEVLTPDEINVFLQTTIRYEDNEKYNESIHMFISILINNSYNAGYNNFRLNTENLKRKINELGEKLEGHSNRIIHISIKGDVGTFCGSETKYASFVITGKVESFLSYAAENSSFTLNGEFIDKCPFKLEYFATSCDFKTPNKKTLELLSGVPWNSSNKVYFIHPDGTEELMREDKQIHYPK